METDGDYGFHSEDESVSLLLYTYFNYKMPVCVCIFKFHYIDVGYVCYCIVSSCILCLISLPFLWQLDSHA